MKTTTAFADSSSRSGGARSPLRAAARTECAPYLPALWLLVAAIALAGGPARAATNDLTTTLQRGLFEEEANQNLGAAIQAYQTVANQFDKDRKLAATAIFRLGECYRKQGNTNDAAAQYERILREFSDQPTLVTLSRQNLEWMGSALLVPGQAVTQHFRHYRVVTGDVFSSIAKANGVSIEALMDANPGLDRNRLRVGQVLQIPTGPESSTGFSGAPVLSDAAEAEAERLALGNELAALKKLPKDQFRITVQQSYPNPVLTSLMQKLTEAQQNLAALKKEYGPQHAEVLSAKAVVETINQQIDEQVEGVLRGLEIKRDVAAKFQGEMAAASSSGNAATSSTAEAPAASTEADEVRRIQALIKDSPDLINAPDRMGQTLLESAAAKGELDVVRLLLDNGAAVDGLQQPGLTALDYAAANGHKAVVDLLLSKGAKPGAQTEGGVTPLHLAADKGYEEVAKALLAAGAPVNAPAKGGGSSRAEDLRYHVNPGQTPLLLAAGGGYTGMVELLLAKGADVNAEDGDGLTPLSYATWNHYNVVVQVLLAAHANPNAGRVNLPLAKAAYQGDLPALKLLLANGADPNTNSMVNWTVNMPGVQYYQGGTFTPLFLSVNQRHADAVEALLRCKADPNVPGPEHNPLLYYALSDTPTLKALLDGGADPNGRTSGDSPMLMQAVQDKNQDAVELLLSHKAEVNCTDQHGGTPLLSAAAMGSKAIAELLLKAGADVNARDKDGNTPLHEAVRNAHLEVAEVLLADKAEPNVRNNAGQTPLDLAKSQAQSAQGQPPGTSFIVAAPIGPAGAPLAYQWQPNAPGASAAPPQQEPKPEAVVKLLRRYGASEDLPRLDCIILRRPSANYSSTVFTKGTNDSNQFTVLELIAVQYRFLAGWPEGEAVPAPSYYLPPSQPLPFPYFARVRLRRPDRDSKAWHEQTIDIRGALETTNCAADVPLEWGDVVELPEADHPLDAQWPGFPPAELGALEKCLTRQVQLVIKGQTTNLTLAPTTALLHARPGPVNNAAFWLKPVLLQSGLVLASSDLSRVKVSRRDAATGQERQWVVDCSEGSPAPGFWLENGDRIEVPEKSTASSAAEAEMPPPSAPGQPLPPSAPAKQVSPDSVEGQLRSQGKRWARASGEITVGAYVQDILEGRLDQPEGRGAIGKVVSISTGDNGVAAATVDFGRGYSVGINLSELSLVSVVPEVGKAARGTSREVAAAAFQQKLNPIPPAPASEAPPAIEEQYLNIGGVLYSPKPDDPESLEAGYHRDRSARTRKAECWEQRARSDLSGRGGNTIWTGTDMIEFGGEGMGTSYGDGARYCFAEDTWAELPQKGEPSSRTGHAMVWTGKEMIVWGGFGGVWGNDTLHNDGARYNPASDTWKPMTKKNAPSARVDFPAVWTGREMLFWGGFTDTHSRYQGYHADAQLNTGGRYNPSSDSWKTITTDGAPSKRCAHTLVWTGKEAIVWGGCNATKALNDGARYNPARDSWKPVSADGAPSPRMGHVAFWTGKEMLVWGGTTRETDTQGVYYENGACYNPESDTWRPISTIGAPKGRVGAVAVWTGTEMIVWGGANDAQAQEGMAGFDPNRYLGTGARYNPATDTWTEMTLTGAPSPRGSPSGVWTGEGLLFFGGYNGTHFNNTWFYSPSRTLYPYVKE